MKKIKYRFDVINPLTGLQELFTGVFQNKYDANDWYKKHGVKWEKKYKLVKVDCIID